MRFSIFAQLNWTVWRDARDSNSNWYHHYDCHFIVVVMASEGSFVAIILIGNLTQWVRWHNDWDHQTACSAHTHLLHPKEIIKWPLRIQMTTTKALQHILAIEPCRTRPLSWSNCDSLFVIKKNIDAPYIDQGTKTELSQGNEALTIIKLLFSHYASVLIRPKCDT